MKPGNNSPTILGFRPRHSRWLATVFLALAAPTGLAGCGEDTPGSTPSSSTMTAGGQGHAGNQDHVGGSSGVAGRDISSGGGNAGALPGTGASIADAAGAQDGAVATGSAGAPTDGGKALVDAGMPMTCGASDAEQINCGASGQHCCAGNRCAGENLVCDLEGNCIGCGGDDKPCCPGNTCAANLCCLQGTAQGDKAPAHCHSLNHCENCGGPMQPCCIRNSCTGGICNQDDVCVACGGIGQACCGG